MKRLLPLTDLFFTDIDRNALVFSEAQKPKSNPNKAQKVKCALLGRYKKSASNRRPALG